jgi:hypothetical protein
MYAQGKDARGVVKKIKGGSENEYAQRSQSYEEAAGVAAPAPGKGDGDDKGDKGYSKVGFSSGAAVKLGGLPGVPGPKSLFSSSSKGLTVQGPRAKGGK